MTAALLPLATQPQGVPRPTTSWPRANLDPRLDRAALEDLLDHPFGDAEPDDLERTNAVVVVQNGAIVAERYRKDVDPDRPFISWSMAKSITSCLIGILVREDKLDVTRPIPVKEWPDGDQRRRITIDQMLRMVAGLRFREAEDLGDGSVRYHAEDESDVIPMLYGAGKDDVAGFATLEDLSVPAHVVPVVDGLLWGDAVDKCEVGGLGARLAELTPARCVALAASTHTKREYLFGSHGDETFGVKMTIEGSSMTRATYDALVLDAREQAVLADVELPLRVRGAAQAFGRRPDE